MAISVGAVITGVLGYAIYFDHRRRTDPAFRKALKRESRKQEKVAKQEADAANTRQRKAIREAVEKANEEGFPSDSEEVESYFMKEVAEGEMLCQDRKDFSILLQQFVTVNAFLATKMIDAALCFFRALKVYPQQEDLINIYDKAVPKVKESSFCYDYTTTDPIVACPRYSRRDDRNRSKYHHSITNIPLSFRGK